MNDKIKNSFQTKGFKVGNKLRVGFPRAGSGQKGKWQYFLYTEGKKDETGEWKDIRRYQVWVASPIDDLENGDYVTIKSILSFNEQYVTYNDGRKFMSIICCCDVEKPKPKNREENNFDSKDFDIGNFNVSDEDINFLSNL